MKAARFLAYFRELSVQLGVWATTAFSLAFLRALLLPPNDGRLARVPVGPYHFLFPSLPYFAGLFTEIFLKKTYYLPNTSSPIEVIDCGANIGVSLLYIKLRAPNARVTCFEPNPAARAVLAKNIAENGWQDVKVLPYALGKEKGIAEFFVERDEATSSGGGLSDYLKQRGRSLRSYRIEVSPLSPFMDRPIDLLKMDVEGAEFGVIEELSSTGALSNVKNIQLEYHVIPDFSPRPVCDMQGLLEKSGFKTTVRELSTGSGGKMRTYMLYASH